MTGVELTVVPVASGADAQVQPLRPLALIAATQTPVALCVLDEALICTWSNGRFDDLAGVPVGGAVGTSVTSLLALAGADTVHLHRVVRGSSDGWHFTVVVHASPGLSIEQRPRSEVWRVHAHPLEAHQGLGLAAVNISDDPGLAVRTQVTRDRLRWRDGGVS